MNANITGLGRHELIELVKQLKQDSKTNRELKEKYLENLTSTQARCTELLLESRRKTKLLEKSDELLLLALARLDANEPHSVDVQFIGEQPTRATDGSVGWDLVAAKTLTISDGMTFMIPTKTRIALPRGFEAQVRGRSGMARRGVHVHLGTIDADYRGPIGVVATFHGNNLPAWDRLESPVLPGLMTFTEGDRIAQLVIQRVPEVRWSRVEELDETERGERGFGSTGM